MDAVKLRFCSNIEREHGRKEVHRLNNHCNDDDNSVKQNSLFRL